MADPEPNPEVTPNNPAPEPAPEVTPDLNKPEPPKEEPAQEEVIDPDKIEPETRTPKGKEEDEPKDEDEPEDDDDEPVLDQKHVNKLIKKGVQEGLTKERQEIQRLKDEAEVTSFIADKPEFKKYKGAMLKYLEHPAYANITVENIAAIVSAKDQQELGAQKEREAAKKAKDTQGGGKTVRQDTTARNWKTATPEEVKAQRAKIG